jgi:hypothetical protein
MECKCGCGEAVATSSYKPGHDQKLRIALEQSVGGLERLRELVENSTNVSTEEGKQDEDRSKDIEKCNKEIDDVFESINRDQGEYDKQLLTLSSAFLAASLAFIKDIVPFKTAIYMPILFTCFGLFAGCIVTVLCSYQWSIFGNLKAKKYWEHLRDGNKTEFPRGHAKLVVAVNLASGIFFVFGVCLLIFFIAVNLRKGA